MFIIGVDPHRGSHVAVVLDDREQIHDELAVTANRLQRQRLLDWAAAISRGCGRSKAPLAPAPCWRSSSSPPASR